MRIVLPLLALMLTAVAAQAEPPGNPSTMRELQTPPDPGERVCRDTIHSVREARDLPPLRRETATPAEPLLIAAVDHRINGCSVMVMRNDTSDVRPLPAIPQGSGRLQRIPGG